MGWYAKQKARNESAKARKSSMLASFGSGPNRCIEVYEDRVEVMTTNHSVATSNKLAEASGTGRFGWKVMPYDTGVEAEVVEGDPGTAQTSRVTVTRLIGLGIFALAIPKKSGGVKPKAVLFIANTSGESITVTLDAARIAEAKVVEAAINGAVGSRVTSAS
jgi:hypothetical protein